MGKILLLLVGLAIGLLIASFVKRVVRGGGRDLTAPPRIDMRPARRVTRAAIDEDEIIDLVRQNRKIEAIKRMRELTGLGLAEAKDAVEEIERGLR